MFVLQEDPELEAIRQRRMAEMMAARGGAPVSFEIALCSKAAAVPAGFAFVPTAAVIVLPTAAVIVTAGSTRHAFSGGCRAARGSSQVGLGSVSDSDSSAWLRRQPVPASVEASLSGSLLQDS